MEMSVREARAGFAAAIAAAQRGERVTITKNGKPVAELGPPPPPVPAPKKPWDWGELDRIQEELGIPKPSRPLDQAWQEWFDGPELAKEIWGPEYL